MNSEAKRAAALAAVYAYLAQGPADGRPAASAGAGGAGDSGASGPSLWALYGRQALMNQRIRMQARRRA